MHAYDAPRPKSMKPTRLQAGALAPAFSAKALDGTRLEIPSGGLVHLQFRRFAGCPICNLHLRSFARRHDELRAAGVTEIAVFHSSARSLERHHPDLPFALLPDPDKQLYALYGLERGLSSMMHPRAMWAAMRGMATAPMNPLQAEGGLTGLPGDFLIDAAGKLIFAKYGAHANDHLEVDDVLRLSGPFAAEGAPRARLRRAPDQRPR